MDHLPTFAFLGERAGIQRVLDLVTDAVAGRAIIYVPGFPFGLEAAIERKPAAVVLASVDGSWVGMELRTLRERLGVKFPTFVLTTAPGAFGDLLLEFPGAKFIDDTGMEPLPKWFPRGKLAKILLEAISVQEPS